MKEWQSEDEIKAQLRELTDATRKLRHDLNDLVRGAEPKAERRYLHKRWQSSPRPIEADEDPRRPKNSKDKNPKDKKR